MAKGSIGNFGIGLTLSTREFTRGLRRASGQMATFTTRTARKFKLLNRAGKAFAGVFRTIGRLAKGAIMGGGLFGGGVAVALTGLTRAIVNAGLEIESWQNTLLASTGTMEKANSEILFMQKVAKDLGLPIQQLVKSFSLFSAATKETRIEGKATRDIFMSVAKVARVMNLSTDDFNGVMRALTQIISKGKVQAEELRGQLGERLPGAFQAAARAMGVTSAVLNKMMDDGRLYSEDLLPKLAKELDKTFGGALEKAVNSTRAAFARLGNAWFELKAKLAQSGVLEYVTKLTEKLTEYISDPAMHQNIGGAIQAIGAFAAKTVRNVGVMIASLQSGFGTLVRLAERAADVLGLSKKSELESRLTELKRIMAETPVLSIRGVETATAQLHRAAREEAALIREQLDSIRRLRESDGSEKTLAATEKWASLIDTSLTKMSESFRNMGQQLVPGEILPSEVPAIRVRFDGAHIREELNALGNALRDRLQKGVEAGMNMAGMRKLLGKDFAELRATINQEGFTNMRAWEAEWGRFKERAKTTITQFDEQFARVNERLQNAAEAFRDKLSNGIRDGMMLGLLNGKDAFLNFFKMNILRAMMTQMATYLAKGMGSMFGGRGTGLITALFGGFATGGEFTVGGKPGNRDENIVAIRANRGERVRVDTPQQQRGGDGQQIVYVDFAGANIQAASEEDLMRVAEAAYDGARGSMYADRRMGRFR